MELATFARFLAVHDQMQQRKMLLSCGLGFWVRALFGNSGEGFLLWIMQLKFTPSSLKFKLFQSKSAAKTALEGQSRLVFRLLQPVQASSHQLCFMPRVQGFRD